MSCQRWLSVLLQIFFTWCECVWVCVCVCVCVCVRVWYVHVVLMLKCKPYCHIQIVNFQILKLLSRLYVPVTVQKHRFCKQTAATSKWRSMSHISDPMPKKKAEGCSKTRKKAKVWRLVKKRMWNRTLTWMHQTCADRYGRRLDQLKSNLLGSPLKECPSTLESFCKFSNYTEWWWCVKVKTLHSMMSRNVLKWLCFNRTELNTLAAHVATPDGTHQETNVKDRATSLPTDDTPGDK